MGAGTETRMMTSEGGEVWLEVFREARYAEGWLGSRSGIFAEFLL